MQIHLSPNDGVPIYLQIFQQVKYQVAAGRLAPGEEIPPIRNLAEQLLINPNTVARAYMELERAGIVTKRHGSGTFIAETTSPLARKDRLRILAQKADSLVAEAQQMGIDLPEVLKIIEQRHQFIKKIDS